MSRPGKQLKYLNLVCDLMPMTLSQYNNQLNSHCMEKADNLVIETIKKLSRKVFEGLAELHERGIAHRDIKPENILVDQATSSAKICDFGSAKQLDTHNYGFRINPETGVMTSSNQTGSVTYISTRYYRAPELLYGNPYYGTEIDLWAAGCVMAELFSEKTSVYAASTSTLDGKPHSYNHVLFRGQSNPHQLALIHKAKGIPTA